MSVLAHDRRSIPPSVAEAARDLVHALVAWPGRVYENRQLARQLGEMSDYELADIGLNRSDVRDTTALPVGSEVGMFLAHRSAEKRHIQL